MRKLIRVAIGVAMAATLSACSEIETSARDAASNAADQATAAATNAARDAARAELCRYVEDRLVSPTEAIALRGAADVAEAAQVSPTLVAAARTVANASTGTPPQNDVEKLAAECTAPAN